MPERCSLVLVGLIRLLLAAILGASPALLSGCIGDVGGDVIEEGDPSELGAEPEPEPDPDLQREISSGWCPQYPKTDIYMTDSVQGISVKLNTSGYEFRVRGVSLVGRYCSVWRKAGSCPSGLFYIDGQWKSCIRTYTWTTHSNPPSTLAAIRSDLLQRGVDLTSIEKIHCKHLLQARAGQIRKAGVSRALAKASENAAVELWHEFNYTPADGALKYQGHPFDADAGASRYSNGWVRASAGYPIYQAAYAARSTRCTGSNATGKKLYVTSNLLHQFMLSENLSMRATYPW